MLAVYCEEVAIRNHIRPGKMAALSEEKSCAHTDAEGNPDINLSAVALVQRNRPAPASTETSVHVQSLACHKG